MVASTEPNRGNPDEMAMGEDNRKQSLTSWLGSHGYKNALLQAASSDASARRYFRFKHGEQSLIAVDTPQPEAENQAFIEIGEALLDAGLRSPAIYQSDTRNGWTLLEDFGALTFGQALLDHENTLGLYQRAVDLIGEIQSSASLQQLSSTLPQYSSEMISRELDIFTQWCLQSHLDIALSSADFADLEMLGDTLATAFAEQPQTFVHRDFHSRNLMLLTDDSLGLLDFQGAVRGPISYDWVSLLRDCYVTLPPDRVKMLVESCYEQAHQSGVCPNSLSEMARYFDCTGVQRHLKATGIFCRLKQQDNKSSYMEDIPRTFSYVLQVVHKHSELAPLQRLIARHQLAQRLC